MSALYNVEKIVRIVVSDFFPDTVHYWIEKEKKFLGITFKRRGLYCTYFEEYLGDKISNKYKLIDGVIHEKPSVRIKYQAGVESTHYFNSLQEAQTFAHKLTEGKNFIAQY